MAVRTAVTSSAGPHDPADLPAGEAERLAGRADRERALGHAGERAQRSVLAVEHEVLVDLVGDRDEVVLDAHACDRLELVGGEHLAGGVVRRVEEEQPRAVVDERRERVDVGLVRRWVQRHRSEARPGHRGHGGVAVVGRLEGEDLVARVAQGEHRRGDRLGGARRHEHLGGGVDVDRPEALLVGGDGDAQLHDPRPRRVLVHAGADGGDGGVGHLDRSVLVREPLPEVDRAGGDRQRRHLGEDRRAEPAQPGERGGCLTRARTARRRRPAPRGRRDGSGSASR